LRERQEGRCQGRVEFSFESPRPQLLSDQLSDNPVCDRNTPGQTVRVQFALDPTNS